MAELSSEGFSAKGHYVTASFEPNAFSKLETGEQHRVKAEVAAILNDIGLHWLDIGKTHPLYVLPITVVDESDVTTAVDHVRKFLPDLMVGEWWVGDEPVATPSKK